MISELFKIEKISINKFYSEEYKGPKKTIDGKSLFVHGTNNTGKSTSFDGIIYSIFGWDFIDRTSSIADTEIILKNNAFELKIKRKYNSEPLMEIKTISGERFDDIRGNDNIYKKLVEFFGIPESLSSAKKLITALTLPQGDDASILRKYSGRDLDYIISTYSSGLGAISRIREIEKEIEKQKNNIEKIKYKKLEVEKEIEDLELEERKNKYYITDLRDFIQQYDSGNLNTIAEILIKNKEKNSILNDLTSKRTGYYDKKFKISEEINRYKQYYNKELIEAIKRTLSVLICPVCGDDLDLNNVEKRKNKGLCPFCGANHSPVNVYEIIGNEIKISNEMLNGLKKDAQEIDDKIKEINQEIEKIITELSIPKINPVIIRDLNAPKDELKEKYENHKEKVRRFENDVAINKNEIIEKRKFLMELEEENRTISDNITQLEKESFGLIETETKEGIRKFSEELNKNYSKLIYPQNHRLEINSNKIFLYKNIIKKDCSDKNSLGFSEKKMVDFAIWATFLSINNVNNTIKLNFGICDDVFENIDNTEIKWKDNLLSMLKDIGQNSQVIIFSIDKDINKIINLDFEIHLTYRTTLNEFIKEET